MAHQLRPGTGSVADRIAQLSAEERAALSRLVKQKGAVASVPRTIPRRPPSSTAPLSFAQQRLWFLDHLFPANNFYNEASAIPILQPLDVAALEQSLNEIVARHEALRTTFVVADGQPVQIIAAALSLPLPIVDLRGLPEPERSAEALRLGTDEARRPFDLAKGPLVRTTLFRLGQDDYLFLLTMHHIVCDGWSMEVFFHELITLYSAFSMGEPSPLPELPIQYADFAIWQRQCLQGEVLEAQLDYWKRQLAGLPMLALPTDRPRPAMGTFQGARRPVKISKPLTEALRALGRQEEATLFMTLLAAYQTLLHRYTGQEDVVVGAPIANRNRTEVETLIGFFVNALVMRADLSGDPSFREALRRVREMALGAYAHEDLPFEKLVDALEQERDLSRNPLFQVTFQLLSAPRASKQAAEEAEEETSFPEIEVGTAKFDLRLDLWEIAQGLDGQIEYSTDLFDEATIARMAGHFQVLLEAIVANPDERLSKLALTTEAERRQLLVEYNDTALDYPVDIPVHRLFEAQVKRDPDAPAVAFGGERLTYAQLNRRANRLACHLRTLGVDTESLVGVCLDRSVDLVVALLGVLKAGAAYVPMDPGYPPDRLAFMTEDAQVKVLLSQQHLSAQLPSEPAPILFMDTDRALIASCGETDPTDTVNPRNLAYVIYTSGSTGAPKGVMIEHGGLANLIAWHLRTYSPTPSDRVTQVAGLAYDATVWELWPYLAAGASVHIVDDVTRLDPAALVEWMATERITLSFVPTPLAEGMVRAPRRDGLALRALLTGGDLLHGPLTLDALPCDLINHYGPTENSVVSTWGVVDGGRPIENPSIGRPIDNVNVYVLDRRLQPVPVGVPGELHVGGAGVARGYLNRPELTAERFIPHPFDPRPGARLYKTGDLVRWLPDGRLDFLGRIDHQVKLRGYRIELGEIEAALRRHPGVREGVVVAREDAPGDKRLVAYLVPHQPASSAPSVSELRDFLQEKLPHYMTPSAFMVVEELPLTPNGKVDRRALPPPDSTRPDLAKRYVPPSSAREELLAKIWSQVLGLEQVGIHDNFFELGGDSILSIQVIARANQEGLRLNPRQFFQHQTIAELATVAGAAPAVQAEQGAVTGSMPLTPIQHWFFEQDLADPHHFNQSVMLEVPPSMDPALLPRAVEALLAHHDALRLRYTREESGWRQFHTDIDGRAPFSHVDLSALRPPEQQGAIRERATDLQASLNLSEGPLLRVALFELGGARWNRLLMVIHHLVVDGVSWRILLEDLQTAYEQLSRGEAVELAPKTTSFKQWSQRLAEYGQSEPIRRELDYWRALGRNRIPRLPTDLAGGANIVASTETVLVSLGAEETNALLHEVPAAYRTQINDVLLTALVQAFSGWSGDRSLLLDLEGHGREALFDDLDVSRTVGWFTTIYPVLLDLEGASGPGEALKAIKEQLRSIPNRGIGYGLLRYLSGDPEIVRQLRALPQAEVSFHYSDQFGLADLQASEPGSEQEPGGPIRSRRGSRVHLLEINGSVAGGQLQLEWTYSEKFHRRLTIEKLVESYLDALRSLIAHCQSPEGGGYTPSDFSKARLSQKDLDRLLNRLHQSKEQ